MSEPPPTYTPWREKVAVALRLIERRDQPLTRVVIIAATPRSGSTMLCRTLQATGALGHTYEVLNNKDLTRSALRTGVPRAPLHHLLRQEQMRRKLRDAAPWYPFDEQGMRDYLVMVARRRLAADGTFGVKLQALQFANHMQRLGLSADVWGVPVTWIHLRRRDRIAQAVSHSKAIQTGQFSSKGVRRGEPVYDADQIRGCIARFEQGDAVWTEHFTTHDITPIEVWYEDLTTDHVGEMRRVLDAIGRSDLQVSPPATERQFDDTNIDWIERFRREEV